MALLKRKNTKTQEAEKTGAEKKGAKKSSAKTVSKKVVKRYSKMAMHTLQGPVISEKSAQLSDEGVLVFKVAKDANRVQVRNAFRELYQVTPTSVNILNVRGKRVLRGRVRGKRSDWKKAMIRLPKGKKIDIFESV
jgi:large subunit ribosomal protein L23